MHQSNFNCRLYFTLIKRWLFICKHCGGVGKLTFPPFKSGRRVTVTVWIK